LQPCHHQMDKGANFHIFLSSPRQQPASASTQYVENGSK